MKIGWFGIPGLTPRSVKTHVSDGRKTLCGWKPGRRKEFQWCAPVRVNTLNDIECLRCRANALVLMTGASEAVKHALGLAPAVSHGKAER